MQLKTIKRTIFFKSLEKLDLNKVTTEDLAGERPSAIKVSDNK